MDLFKSIPAFLLAGIMLMSSIEALVLEEDGFEMGKPDVSLMHNDILLSPKQLQMRKYNGVRGATIKERGNNRWENNIVPYTISNKYTSREKKIIENSLKTLEQVSCFRFPPRTTQKNYLDIDKRDGCYSFVGKIGGRQLLSLSGGCVYSFIVIHELLHVLGLEHEHQRPDRDQFLKIVYSNVESDKMSNFGKLAPDEVYYKEHPYDYRSIMHYDGTAFGRTDSGTGKKLVTMIPLQSNVELQDNYELTDLDIRKLNDLGKCRRNQFQPTQNDDSSNCRDQAQNCGGFKSQGLCENTQYKTLMQQQCQLTCQFCTPSRAAEPQTCEDKTEACNVYVSNGFCDNVFYESSKHLCAKSCGLCE